jgi:hypothetical protein
MCLTTTRAESFHYDCSVDVDVENVSIVERMYCDYVVCFCLSEYQRVVNFFNKQVNLEIKAATARNNDVIVYGRT